MLREEYLVLVGCCWFDDIVRKPREDEDDDDEDEDEDKEVEETGLSTP